METRAKCSGNRCFQSDMELPSELSISSIQPDCSVPQKDTERSSRMHSHCTSLEKQTVVSNSTVNVVTPAFTVTSVPISSSAPRNEQNSHILYPNVFQTSCMENFRQVLQGQGFLRRCPTFSSPHGEKALQGKMRVLGDGGVACVTRGRLIVFQHLSKTSWHTGTPFP